MEVLVLRPVPHVEPIVHVFTSMSERGMKYPCKESIKACQRFVVDSSSLTMLMIMTNR